MAEHSIVQAQATAEEAEDFNRLFVISAPKFVPALYGGIHERVNRNLFRYTGNILSFEHTSFMKVDGRNAGMIVTLRLEAEQGVAVQDLDADFEVHEGQVSEAGAAPAMGRR